VVERRIVRSWYGSGGNGRGRRARIEEEERTDRSFLHEQGRRGRSGVLRGGGPRGAPLDGPGREQYVGESGPALLDHLQRGRRLQLWRAREHRGGLVLGLSQFKVKIWILLLLVRFPVRSGPMVHVVARRPILI